MARAARSACPSGAVVFFLLFWIMRSSCSSSLRICILNFFDAWPRASVATSSHAPLSGGAVRHAARAAHRTWRTFGARGRLGRDRALARGLRGTVGNASRCGVRSAARVVGPRSRVLRRRRVHFLVGLRVAMVR